MDAGQRERRQFGSLRIPAQLQVQFSDHMDLQFFTVNISQNGILVKAPDHLDIGEFVRVFIQVPPANEKVEALGKVARRISRDSSVLLGIQFLEMDHIQRERWLEYMAKVEGLTTDQSQVTSSTVMLEERKKEGRNRQFFLIRFDHKEALQKLMIDSILIGKFEFPYTTTRTPGDLITLVLVHPETDRTLEIEAQISSNNIQESYDHLSLTFAPFTDEQQNMVSQFMEGQVQFEETATRDRTLFDDLSETEQTVLMDRIVLDEP